MEYHRPTVAYLAKAAAEHELRSIDPRIEERYREQNRQQAQQLRRSIDASIRKASLNGNAKRDTS